MNPSDIRLVDNPAEDPRIGAEAVLEDGHPGVVVSLYQFPDGMELANIQDTSGLEHVGKSLDLIK